ncbi:MAG: FliG C-terminal domain-containing protein [Pseudomonadota bacterium]
MSTVRMQTTTLSPEGIDRSARLLKALGPRGGAIWAALSPDDATTLSVAVDNLAPDSREDSLAAEAFLRDAPSSSPNDAPVWSQLDALSPQALVALLNGERPQFIALALSKVRPETAARVLNAMPQKDASIAVQALLSAPATPSGVLAAFEAGLAEQIERVARSNDRGHGPVARLFDAMDSEAGRALLSTLESQRPGDAAQVRGLMFAFENLNALHAAGLQTLLANIDRNDLAVALKGASDEHRQPFLDNLTQRAGAALLEDIDALGPISAKRVDAARRAIAAIARDLISSGEIGPIDDPDQDLIE